MFKMFKNSKNRMSVLGVLLSVLVVIIYAGLRFPGGGIPSAYPDIAQFDLNANYPATPELVIDYNNGIVLALYNGGIEDHEIALAFTRQRELFAEELLGLNPFEESLVELTNDVLSQKKAKRYITGFESGYAQYPEGDKTICTVDVTQKSNYEAAYRLKYYLVTENGKWKILAWELLEETYPEGN